MSPRQPTPEDAESATVDETQNRPADERGVVYHGDTDDAEEESERGVIDHAEEEEGESDVERGSDDEEPTDPRNRDA